MSLITCDNLSLSYDSRFVIKNLSFSVEKGDYLCIVGENGSGKSTLIKALLGLKAPSSGKIFFGEGLKENEVGYLPQRTELQKDFPASVYEVVLSGCLGAHPLFPFYKSSDRKTADENLVRLGIKDLSRRSFAELSGGQQQRVLLARALCATKKLILLDEPAAGLDPAVTAELYAIIDGLHSEGITVITVSHDLVAAISHATKVLHLSGDGYELSSPDEFLNSLSKKGGV